MAELGYVGLGTMGGRMAKRLIDAGHAVVGYNRTKSKAEWLIKAGMAWADSPRAVAERSDIVLSMVTNTAAVISITEGPDGIIAGLGPGKIYIDMSTASPSNGLAVAMKIASNLSLAVQMLAFSEGILLAEKRGIRRETAVEVLLNSVAGSPMLKYRGPFVLGMPEEGGGNVNMMQKDMLLALEMGRE